MHDEWTPLVAEDARVTAALDAIAADAIACVTAAAQPEDKADDFFGCGLFLGYLALARQDQESADQAAAAVERALELCVRASGPALFGGFSAVGWLAAHLDGQVMDLSDASPEGLIMRSLRAAMDDPEMHFDLISGLSGMTVCAAEFASQAGDAVLLTALDRLEALCKPDGALPPFFIPPHRASELKLKDYPRGYVDLGIAHGVPGVIGALVTLHQRLPEQRARIRGSLRTLTEFMVARAPTAGAAFVSAFEPLPGEGPPPRARYAWCYGAPGLVPPLREAGRLLGDADVVAVADALGVRAAAVSRKESGVFDVSLCHGTAGLAAIFARMYHDTGDAAHADAARRWLSQTLDERRPDESRTGFRSLYVETTPRWVEAREVLLGSTGVGLALLALTTEVAPAWDRVLMTTFVDAV